MFIGGGADLTWRVLPQWKARAKGQKRVEGGDVVVQAYRSLIQNIANKVKPKVILHQMDHLLRLVLAQKEKTDWLEEPDLDKVPVEIRSGVRTLFEKCQEAYRAGEIELADVDQTLKLLDEVLQFYYGAGEVEAWKN